ncbi:hypothetical protein [Catellatospora sp. NPDC049133]|uniref:hypothetical protein n=1 Tax=Catellatospora sp. NPDC049133 TaxID=3155499 RepID=UPI00340A9D85
MTMNTSALTSEATVSLNIANMFEFNSRHARDTDDESLSRARRAKENFGVSAEAALFWGGATRRRIVITPEPPDADFLQEIQELLGVQIESFSPKLVTGWVCRDLMRDTACLQRLFDMLQNEISSVLPWGFTSDLLRLLSHLQDSGLSLILEESNLPSSAASVDYLDSKIGSRSIFEHVHHKVPEFYAIPGYACQNLDLAKELASTLLISGSDPLVLKSDRGHGGSGVRLLDSIDSAALTFSEILTTGDGIWTDTPVLLERAIGGGTKPAVPNFNGIVGMNGDIRTCGIGQLKISGFGTYVGMEFGVNVVSDEMLALAELAGRAAGDLMRELGYAGWYDLDFILDPSSDRLYGSEINARRTGGSVCIELADQLLATDWRATMHVSSYEHVKIRSSLAGYTYLRPAFADVRRSLSGDCGIVPIFTRSISLKSAYVGYVIYAPSRAIAAAIDNEIKMLLGKLS